MPQILINGVAADQISALDRACQYGDGLFETLRIVQGRPQFWPLHLQRLQRGCEHLGIPLSDRNALEGEARQLCAETEQGVLKLILSRGSGGRGYRPPEPVQPTRILARFPLPDYPAEYRETGIRACVCRTPLGLNPALAGLKHLNRLEQVLARTEWDDPTIAEGLMLDVEGRVIEGTMSNLFVVRKGGLHTPQLDRCGVAGVMRELVMELAVGLDIPLIQTKLELDDVYSAEEIFFTNSLIGIWPVRELAAQTFPVGPLTRRLQAALEQLHD